MSIVPTGNNNTSGTLGGPSSEPAAPHRFEVVVDGIDLGSFTACEGLSAEYKTEPYEEGGVNGYVHQFPLRLSYPNIKLSRALDGSSAGQLSLAAWFSKFDKGEVRTQTARTVGITAYTASGVEVGNWSLHDAIPVRWMGPSFSSDGTGAAKETLEFAHQGFL
jgi:phage tail-like protein